MAYIYGTIGTEKMLFEELHRRGISTLATIDDVRRFEKNFPEELSRLESAAEGVLNNKIDDHVRNRTSLLVDWEREYLRREEQLLKEKAELQAWLDEYQREPAYSFAHTSKWLLHWSKKARLLRLDAAWVAEVTAPLSGLQNLYQQYVRTLEDMAARPDVWRLMVREEQTASHKRTMQAIGECSMIIAGIVGEEQVARSLDRLPDEFGVFHDFRLRFPKPIYNQRSDDYILSVQIDHLVVGPSGLFIVETKNWSKESMNSGEFLAPEKQLERFNWALYTLLNDAATNGQLHGFHTWGRNATKIAPRQILAMAGAGSERYENHVQHLRTESVGGYIIRGKKTFEPQQVIALTHYLYNLTGPGRA